MSVLSLHERDRRWGITRDEMKKRGLSCVVVSGLMGGFANYTEWLANDSRIQFVIFPLDKEPTCIMLLTQSHYRDKSDLWVSDHRAGPIFSEAIVNRLKELGISSGKVGVVGVAPQGMATQGTIPYTTWTSVLSALPGVTFEDATWWLTELILPKSDEEMKLVERTAEITELGCEAFVTAARPGVGEDVLYRAFTSRVMEERAQVQMYLSGMGKTTLVQFEPEWLTSGFTPKILRSGEIITTEMDVCYARYHAQVQQCVALKPVDDLHRKCSEIAQGVIESARRTLRPGVRFQEVADAVEAPLQGARAWHPGPMLHSMNPQILRTTHSADYSTGKLGQTVGGSSSTSYFKMVRGADIVLKKNMVFEVEPCVCLGDHRVLLGGTAVVEENGPRFLNSLAFEMQVV